MSAVNITVDVHCIRPPWLQLSNDPNLTAMYRLYIDNNLLTERTWIWPNNTLIQENIWIHAGKDSSHILTVEPVLMELTLKNYIHATFTISNFSIINTPFTVREINDLSISFTLE